MQCTGAARPGVFSWTITCRGPVIAVVRHDWQHALEAPTATRTHGATSNAAGRYSNTSILKRIVAGSWQTAEWRAQYRRLMASLCMQRPCVIRGHRPGCFPLDGCFLLETASHSNRCPRQKLPTRTISHLGGSPAQNHAYLIPFVVRCSNDRRGFTARSSLRERDSRPCLLPFTPPLLVVFR